jgi:CRP-like cAMP-binding protein
MKELCPCTETPFAWRDVLDSDQFTVLCNYLKMGRVSAGELLWSEGENSDSMAMIISGRVQIMKETGFPGKEMVIGIYGKGSIVGELSVLDNRPLHVSAKALENVDLFYLTRQDFEKLTGRHPELGVRILTSILSLVSIRKRNTLERLANFF